MGEYSEETNRRREVEKRNDSEKEAMRCGAMLGFYSSLSLVASVWCGVDFRSDR